MRTLGQVKKEIEYNTKIANAENLGDSYDNAGRLSMTANERRELAKRALERLAGERKDFHRILGIEDKS